MTIIPIDAAAAAYLAGTQEVGAIIYGAPHPELARLLAIQAERGSIPQTEYDAASRALGRSKRQIQRMLAQLRKGAQPAGRRAFELTGHHEQVIMACEGNVALAYRELVDAGEVLPAYDSFWRAWYSQPTGKQAYARHGADGMVECWVYPPYEAPERNSVWQADHFELPLFVIADGCTTTTVKPWLTVLEDDRTRKVMAWTITAAAGRHPDAEVVCATLANGIRIRLEDGIEVGGVPRIVRWDNAKEFSAGMVLDMGNRIGFECHAVPPYSGHMKGKVERLGKRVQDQFCVLQPGYSHGPRTYRQKNPFRDMAQITANELRARLDVWMADYDRTVHEGIDETPLERWTKDTTPLRRATAAQLRPALLVEPQRHEVIRRKGVSFRGQFWQSADLMDLIGKKVEIRYPAGHDIDFIEIYRNGQWRCTAWPAATLTEAQRKEIFEKRSDQYKEVRALHNQATRIREGANATTKETDATPAVASMPAVDPLAADADDRYDLLNRASERLAQESDTAGDIPGEPDGGVA